MYPIILRAIGKHNMFVRNVIVKDLSTRRNPITGNILDPKV